MRVAPLGAYFADAEDIQIRREAELSAEVTHSHPEGIAGAVAVAMATAFAWRRRATTPLGRDWLEEVVAHTPSGYTRDGVIEALEFPQDSSVVDVAVALGDGSGVTAPDTVPLCLWVCAWHSSDFGEAIWTTVSALGDRDTTCAIVGGILGPRVGTRGVPQDWVAAREALPF